MKRIRKICLAVALFLLVCATCFVLASAEESPTVAFTVTTPDGTSTDYYDETQLAAVASAAKSGSTVVIQSDIGTYANIAIPTGKVLYIDLNGKTLINKALGADENDLKDQDNTKTSFVAVNGGELHLYSSKPGAAYFARNQVQQNPFIKGENAKAYIGGYPAADGTVYPGDNISAYGCTAFNFTGTSVANIDGGYYYRNHSDYSGLLIAQHTAVLNLKDVKLYASYNAPIFSFQRGTASKINCDGCVVVGPSSASKIIPSDKMQKEECVLTLKDTVVCNGMIEVGTGLGRIVVESGCLFDTISDEEIKTGKIQIAPGVSYARTDRTVTVDWRMNDYYGNTDAPFALADKTTVYEPAYGFAAEEMIATVTWRLGPESVEYTDEETGETYTKWEGGRTLTDRWIVGSTPRFTEEGSPYGEYFYEFSEVEPVTGDAQFVSTSLGGRPTATMKAKIRLHAGLDFLLYFPTSLADKSKNLWYNDVTWSGSSLKKLNARDKQTIDGVEYYVIEVGNLGVADVLSDLSLTFGVTLRVINEYTFTNTLSFSVLDYAETLLALEGTEFDKEKALLLHYLAFVSAAAPEDAPEESLARLSDILRSDTAVSILGMASILDLDRQIPEVTASTGSLFPVNCGLSSVHLDAVGGRGLVLTFDDSFSGYVTFSYKNAGNSPTTPTSALFTNGKNAKGETTLTLTGTRAGKITVSLLGTDKKTQKAKFTFTLNDYIADVGMNAVSKAYCDYLGFLYVMRK